MRITSNTIALTAGPGVLPVPGMCEDGRIAAFIDIDPISEGLQHAQLPAQRCSAGSGLTVALPVPGQPVTYWRR